MITEFFTNLLNIFLDAAPWLLLGLLAAGLIKAWVPDEKLIRWLGGDGIWPVTKAALIGAPLPLCSCGVLPAALGLHRGGASRSSTISFLIATPETGADSIAVSYALLGPFMTIVRPVAAIASAIFTGLLCAFVPENRNKQTEESSSCSGCCSGACASPQVDNTVSALEKTKQGLRYAVTDIFEDIVVWLAIGIGLAAVIATFIPAESLAEWGSGLPAMLMMLLVGIPMYICATASTPVAASLLVAGISPGTVLVFLLAGPATNIATLAVVKEELGKAVLVSYLIGISVTSISTGLAVDWMVKQLGVSVVSEMGEGGEVIPLWLAWTSAVLLTGLALRIMVRRK